MSATRGPDDALILLAGLDRAFALLALAIASLVLVATVATGLVAMAVARRAWRKLAGSQAALAIGACSGTVCGLVAAWVLFVLVTYLKTIPFDEGTNALLGACIPALAALLCSASVVDVVRRGNAQALAGGNPSPFKPRFDKVFVIALLELAVGFLIGGAFFVAGMLA